MTIGVRSVGDNGSFTAKQSKGAIYFFLDRQKTPTLVNALCGKPIAGVSCGATYSCAYTLGGEVYTWGCYGSEDQMTPTLMKWLRGHKVVDVACVDNNHVLAVTDTGMIVVIKCLVTVNKEISGCSVYNYRVILYYVLKFKNFFIP